MFPVVNLEGEFIESKRLIWGFPVMNYLELVAVAGIALTVIDFFLDLAMSLGGVFGGLVQISEMISYFLIIRLERKTCTWYVLSMLAIGVGIMLRVLLNILYFGLPTILESQNSFKERLETNEIFNFFIPSSITVLTDDVVSDVRRNLLFSVFRSILIVSISCILFFFIERARELSKHLHEASRLTTPRDLEAGKGTGAATFNSPTNNAFSGSKTTGRVF